MKKKIISNLRNKKSKKVSKWLFWTPRILTILFIIFLSLFSLDVFENKYSFFQIIIALFIHNIPSLILIIVLIMSWKNELIGAICFFIAGLLYILLLLRNPEFEWYMISWSIIIAGPAFIIGILYWLNYKRKK